MLLLVFQFLFNDNLLFLFQPVIIWHQIAMITTIYTRQILMIINIKI